MLRLQVVKEEKSEPSLRVSLCLEDSNATPPITTSFFGDTAVVRVAKNGAGLLITVRGGYG